MMAVFQLSCSVIQPFYEKVYEKHILNNIIRRLLKKESDLLREGRRNSCINFAKVGSKCRIFSCFL